MQNSKSVQQINGQKTSRANPSIDPDMLDKIRKAREDEYMKKQKTYRGIGADNNSTMFSSRQLMKQKKKDAKTRDTYMGQISKTQTKTPKQNQMDDDKSNVTRYSSMLANYFSHNDSRKRKNESQQGITIDTETMAAKGQINIDKNDLDHRSMYLSQTHGQKPNQKGKIQNEPDLSANTFARAKENKSALARDYGAPNVSGQLQAQENKEDAYVRTPRLVNKSKSQGKLGIMTMIKNDNLPTTIDPPTTDQYTTPGDLASVNKYNLSPDYQHVRSKFRNTQDTVKALRIEADEKRELMKERQLFQDERLPELTQRMERPDSVERYPWKKNTARDEIDFQQKIKSARSKSQHMRRTFGQDSRPQINNPEEQPKVQKKKVLKKQVQEAAERLHGQAQQREARLIKLHKERYKKYNVPFNKTMPVKPGKKTNTQYEASDIAVTARKKNDENIASNNKLNKDSSPNKQSLQIVPEVQKRADGSINLKLPTTQLLLAEQSQGELTNRISTNRLQPQDQYASACMLDLASNKIQQSSKGRQNSSRLHNNPKKGEGKDHNERVLEYFDRALQMQENILKMQVTLIEQKNKNGTTGNQNMESKNK